MNRLLPLLVLLFLSCGACKKSSETKSLLASSPIQDRRIQQTYSAEPKIPACTLITTDEVGAIQGATITDAKNSAGVSGGMLMSRCYYSSKEPNMSVSLAVIEHNPQDASALDAKSYWAESFRRSTGDESDEEKPGERKEKRGGAEREENEKRGPRKKVDGIGKEAYWSGNRFGGALYVLAKDAIVRISVGGPDNEQTRVDKSKALALKALERLP